MAGGRNVLAQNANIKQKQEVGIYILGWTSFFLAIIGGTFAARTWIGDVVSFVVGLVPWDYTPHALLVVGAIVTFLDLFSDMTPNQGAVTSAILGPIVAVIVNDGPYPSKLASRIDEWSMALQGQFGGQLTDWIGNIGASGMAVICIAVATLTAKRVLAKQSAAKAAAGGGR